MRIQSSNKIKGLFESSVKDYFNLEIEGGGFNWINDYAGNGSRKKLYKCLKLGGFDDQFFTMIGFNKQHKMLFTRGTKIIRIILSYNIDNNEGYRTSALFEFL